MVPDYWNEDKQALKQRTVYNTKILKEKDAKAITDKFNELKNVILTEHYKLTGPATKDWLQGVLDKFYAGGKVSKPENLNQYIKRFIEEATTGMRLCYSGTTKKAFSPGTLRSYRDFRRSFNMFQGIYEEPTRKRKQEKEEKKRPYKPLNFNDVTIDFYNDFLQFFYDRGCGANYIGKQVKTLKTIMRQAREEKLHNNLDIEYKAFKVITEPVDSIYLTEGELKSIYDLDLSGEKHLEVARDVFLCGCYTAQRYSDYSRITKDNIKTYEGKRVVELEQAKTGEKCIIPIRPELEAILQKYDYTLPKTYEQKVNKYIKIVGEKAGIKEVVRFEQRRGALTVKKGVHKYELIKTHTARRTGCSLMYLAKIPVIDIMKLSGHKTEREFLKYIKIGKLETAVYLSQHPYFIGKPLSVVK